MSTTSPGLNTFEESANIIEVSMETTRDVTRNISQPYDISVPKDLVERNFLVASFNWTPTTLPQTIDFPSALAGFSSISDVFKKYRYVRFDVHVEIKLSSTPYHQGTLLAAVIPVPGTKNTLKYLNVCAGMPQAAVLRASTQDSATFDIPWYHPLDWFDWNLFKTTNAHSMVVIQQLNTLTATSQGILASCPVNVWASFRNVQVSGYVSQSKFVSNKEAKAKTEGFDTKAVVSTISQMARKAPVVGQIWNPVADAINSYAGNLSKPVVEKLPSNSAPYREQNLAAAVEDVTQISLYPNAKVETAPVMYGMETSHMSLAQIAKTPTLFDQVTFDGTTTSWTTYCYPHVKGISFPFRDYLFTVANNAVFWRGSIKYMIHFVMPAFYEFRVAISLNYGGVAVNVGDITTRYLDIKGDTTTTVMVPYLFARPWSWSVGTDAPELVIKMITPIIGSNAVSTPKVYVNIWRAAGEDFQLAVPKGWTTFPEVKRNRIGYKDQMNIRQEFQKPFEPLIKAVSQSMEKGGAAVEVIGSVNDLVKRPAPTNTFRTIVRSQATGDSVFECMKRFFLFWKGSRTIRRQNFKDTAGDSLRPLIIHTGSNAPDITEGVAWLSLNGTFNQFVEGCNMPYYSDSYYEPMPNQDLLFVHPSCYENNTLDLTSTSILPSDNWWINGGDDFTMMFVVPYFSTVVTEKKEEKKESV